MLCSFHSESLQRNHNRDGDFHAAGILGVLFGEPIRVVTSDRRRFVNLSGLADLSGDAPIPLRVMGLVLKDTNGKPVMVAHLVERFPPPR